MRPFAILGCAAILAACGRPEDRSVGAGAAGDTMAVETGGTADAGTISLSNLAGTWKVRSTDEGGGNPIETELRATADTSGWTLTGPNRKTFPVRVVAVGGDSIVTETGPRESFLRKGTQVTTRTVYRLEGDKLVGRTESRFKIAGRDSVAQRINEGSRVR
jgi:hypothetical protein